MLRRALLLLLGTIGVAACQSSDTGPPVAIHQVPLRLPGPAPVPGVPVGKIAILLPLTGKLADIGKPMLKAARLALQVPGSPELEVKDTGGTPDGAARAAQEVLADGVKLILGPVTSGETAQVALVTRPAGALVLAFTNDQAQSQPGVWTLGITPGQQVRRLMGAVRAAGKGPVCALLPDNDFGKAVGDELTRIAAAQGQPAPFVRMIGPGRDEIESAVNELADLAPEGQPPPYGAILLASIGNDLRVFAKAFADAKIDRSQVQILGPALWVEPASGSGAMIGAWFAMPDPDARRDFVRDYGAQFREQPPPRADLAYDAASIARVLGQSGTITPASLTQPVGFAGVDGWLALLADGHVRRGLAVFEVGRTRPAKISESPVGLGAPGT